MEARALWEPPTKKDSATTTTAAATSTCTPFTLPANGVITIDGSAITLASDAVFTPQCTGSYDFGITITETSPTSSDLRDPFWSSTLPACYALATTTVVAYMLVIILFITPRSFLSGGTLVLGRRGFTNGPSGGEPGIGIGGRPWLQKVAAVTVAVSLTIATANTFNIAEYQYNSGTQNANELQSEVLNGQELKIIRIISDTFLWLAQAQTLIRLFPRQREKVIIKWTALALISLNLLFSILNTFVYEGDTKPKAFVDAIPALSYLFHLALGLLYCAWVMYYAILKVHYAFYHPQMRNICLVALIAIISVFVPVVFFIVDISNPALAQWGDYVRWVGAAAASVVVWEWVERIEALERNDKKDGVLGREVFDGDEMLEVTPSLDIPGTGHLRRGGNSGGGNATGALSKWPAMSSFTSRYRPRALQTLLNAENTGTQDSRKGRQTSNTTHLPLWPRRPPPVATPISRTETASAESTQYAVRYHPIGERSIPIPEHPCSRSSAGTSIDIEAQNKCTQIHEEITNYSSRDELKAVEMETKNPSSQSLTRLGSIWRSVESANPFNNTRHKPPAEVSQYTAKEQRDQETASSSGRRDIMSRLEDFAVTQAEKLRAKNAPDSTASLPVTRIPAPARKRTLQEVSEELELESAAGQVAPSNVLDMPSVRPAGQNLNTADPHLPNTADDSEPVTYRGSLSFAAPIQHDWDTRQHEALGTSPVDRSTYSGTRSPPARTDSGQRSPISQTHTPASTRLPVLRIPAPPRRPRLDE